MKRVLLAIVCSAAAAGAMGCDKSSDDDTPVAPVRQGDIGAVTFTYACNGAGDAQCNVDSDLAPPATDSSFPPIGEGTKFVVTMKWNGTDQPPNGPLALSGAGTTFFTVDTTAPDKPVVSSLKAGGGSLLALSGTEVVDITSIDVRAIDHLKILQADPAGDFKSAGLDIDPAKGSVSANASEVFTFKFRAVPADKDDTILVGQLPVTWTSMDTNVVHITSPADDNVATFQSGAAGSTTIHVTVGTLATDISIKVGS